MTDDGLIPGMLSPTQLRDIAFAARARGPVLVSAETSTLRRACARLIHDACVRERRPFIAVSCNPDALQHDEETWDDVADRSTTGSGRRLRMWLEMAKGGTLFLDDLGYMGLVLQRQLWSVLDVAFVRDADLTQEVRIIAGVKPGWPTENDRTHFHARLLGRLSTMRVECAPVPLLRRDGYSPFFTDVGPTPHLPRKTNPDHGSVRRL